MKSQSERAYQRMREKILSGMVIPGSRLVEQALSEEIGVNRGDVRQALSRLCAEGLAAKGEKGGFFVRQLTDKDVEEIYEVRYILETSAVRLIIQRAHEEEYRQLDEIVDHMELMAGNNYMLGVYEADLRFHTALVKAAHNEKLFDMYISANIPLSGVHGWRHEVARVDKDYMKDVGEHRRIVEHLRKKNADAAIHLLNTCHEDSRDGAELPDPAVLSNR
jgi:DNA-binding GntR family transcriptional regulator